MVTGEQRKTVATWEKQSSDEDFLQMSIILFPGVSLEFGQSSVYPEMGARLHRVLFVVISESQKRYRCVTRKYGKDLTSSETWHGLLLKFKFIIYLI